ncbi:MAG TPA: hypothetical protein DCR14_17535 [Acidimicrobiaceae bacterium]|nr:hypothetical protein [Acidimicrobiaceae bacterium]
MRRMLLAPTTVIALVALAACSSDNTSVAPSTSAAVTTVAPESSTTLATSTTDAPPATDPTTTPAPTTPPTAGWSVIDASTVGAPLAFPCCGSNWYGGSVSPPLPAAGQPLADGVYSISIEWPDDPTAPITATVARFDQCSALPVGSCEDMGGSYAPDEYGIDPSGSMELTFTLDASVTVVLGGFGGGDGSSNFASGSGADLAELIAQLNADYRDAVLSRRDAGMTFDEIVADLVANPSNGFSAPAEEFAGSLAYTYGDAPPLLFQGLPGFGPDPDPAAQGSDIIGSISLVVSGGALQIQVYAGFYS